MSVLDPVRKVAGTLALLPDVARAVLILPRISEQLAEVCRNTRELPVIVEQLRAIEADTGVLPEMRSDTADMNELLVPLGRFGRRRGRRAPSNGD